MDDPLERAADLLQPVHEEVASLRLLGGLACRAHLGTLARRSDDLDVVAMSASARDALLDHLRKLGFAVGPSGGWWRAVRGKGKDREIVDVAPHPIVNPRTFDAMTLRSAPMSLTFGDASLHAVGIEDLLVLKLVAGRDQDHVDLVLLTAHADPSAAEIARRLELDDLGRLAAGSVANARHALSKGYLSEVFAQLVGRAPTERERSAFELFLVQLGEAGL